MRLRRCESRSTWDGLVSSFQHSLLFHTWDWLDFQERVLGVAFERLVVLHAGEEVGVVPVARSSRRSPISSSLPDPFLGPLVPAGLVRLLPGALRRWQLRSGLLLGRYDVGPLLAPRWRVPLDQSASAVRDRETVIIELGGLDSEEELRASYSRNHRRSLKRAIKEGASARTAAPGEVAALLPGVLEESSRRHDRAFPYHPDVGRLVEEWASGREDVGLLTAEVHGETAGVLVVLGGRPTALGWVGGCFERFRDVNVNVVLYHEMLRWALERGHERIDLCAGVADEGGLAFKLAFGGEQVSGLHVESSLVPQVAVSGVRRLRDASERARSRGSWRSRAGG